MARRAVVLGASGFIGNALVQRLSREGVEVHAFSSQQLDMRQFEAFRVLTPLLGDGTDIIDLAAITPDRGTTIAAFAENVAMTANLARYLAERSLRSCVYLSSDAVYGPNESPMTETSPLERIDERLPRTNLYVAAKLASERALAAIADQAGFPLLVLRPCAVFGTGDSHDAYGPNRFVRTLRAQRKVQLVGFGEELRDHIHIEDLVTVIAGLVERRHTGVLNVATGTARTFASVVDVLRTMAPRFEVEHLPRQIPVRHRSYDITSLQRALPEMRFAAFEDRLRETLADGC